MKFKYLRYLIYTDFYRVTNSLSVGKFINSLFNNEGFTYCFWMRVCAYLRGNFVFRYPFYYIAKGILRHYKYKYGISIPFSVSIGPGFYIGHFGGIFVNPAAKIGKNCNISQDVTLGVKNRGQNMGSPIIGDNVYLGPGVKVFGKINISNYVAIGANCVVTKDIPENSVVVGIPGKVISEQGSSSYINRTDYKNFEEF